MSSDSIAITEFASTVTSKGQVTIPADVRRHLGIEKGARILFAVKEDGTVVLRTPRYPTIASLAGVAGSLKEPMEWKKVLEIARDDALLPKYRRKID